MLCATGLDFYVPRGFTLEDGTEVDFSRADLKEAILRRIDAMAARRLFLDACSAPSLLDGGAPAVEVGHAVWIAKDSPFPPPHQDFADCEPVRLPATGVLGLQSAVRNSDLHVVLWSYQPIADLPPAVELRPAAQLLPAAAVRAFSSSRRPRLSCG